MRALSPVLCVVLSVAATRAAAQSCPAIELEGVVTTGLSSPLFVGNAGDGTNRLFIVEQGGVIKVLQPGTNMPSTFLTIPPAKLTIGGEQGLLGLAFHPDFATNRRFFVNYTRSGDGATVIAEYRASAINPDLADPTETILLTYPQPFSNHNGGWLGFGPDGYLYIGSGDGGSGNDPGNRAQNVDELLGKILRIDIDTPNGSIPYSSPPDNPFFGATAGADEIFAFGMRNPWRDSFDRQTGELFAGDVGQSAREEVDIITKGGNYGWRVREGNVCTNIDPLLCSDPGFTSPIVDYSHSGGRCSVTGGYVYRGTAGSLPDGAYLYGDFCTGEIFKLEQSGGTWSSVLALDSSLSLSSFGEDEAGEHYAVGISGQVYRILNSIRIAPGTATYPSAGGTGSVAVTSPAGCSGWTAVSHDAWITITGGATGTGNGSVAYSVASNPASTARSGTMTIAGHTFTVEQNANDPLPVLSIANTSLAEDSGLKAASFAVTLTPASGRTVTANYATGPGSATEGTEYKAKSGSLSFAPGQTTKTITVVTRGDLIDEPNETFVVNLSGLVNATPGTLQGTATIVDDDDTPPAILASINDATVVEGDTGNQDVTLTVTLSAPSAQTLKVSYVTGPDSALRGVDYIARSGTLTFLPGQLSKTLTVPVRGDLIDESAESFFVFLGNPQGLGIADDQGVVTIIDNDGV